MDFEEFWMMLMKAAEKYASGALTGEDGRSYLERTWKDFEIEAPSNTSDWLRGVVTRDFRWMSEKPRWGSSPEWQFHAGMPMLFVKQLNMPEDVSQYAGWGYDIYVFATKEPVMNGWRSIVKVVTQTTIK